MFTLEFDSLDKQGFEFKCKDKSMKNISITSAAKWAVVVAQLVEWLHSSTQHKVFYSSAFVRYVISCPAACVKGSFT